MGAAVRRPTFVIYMIVPAALLSVVIASGLLLMLQDAFRTAIPGSLEVGGFTLRNFDRILRPIYVAAFRDTLAYAAICALANLLLGYPLAYALVRSRSAAVKSAILIVTLIPLFSGDIVRTYGWLVVLGKYGVLNSTLGALGFQPVEMLYTSTGVLVALIQYAMPVMVIILAAAISHVDTDLEKAARSLGASPVKTFGLVTLPLTIGGIVGGTVTIFAWTLSAFATPQIIGGGKVQTIATMIYTVGFSNFDFPFAAALSLVSLVLIAAILSAGSFLTGRALRARVTP